MDSDDLLIAFGTRVRALREDRDWSQERLAEASGLHRIYIDSLERGIRNVGLKNVGRLVTALDVPIGDLFVID